MDVISVFSLNLNRHLPNRILCAHKLLQQCRKRNSSENISRYYSDHFTTCSKFGDTNSSTNFSIFTVDFEQVILVYLLLNVLSSSNKTFHDDIQYSETTRSRFFQVVIKNTRTGSFLCIIDLIFISLTLNISCIMLKKGQTYIKNFAV